jgi:hypothetical protein
MGTYSSAFTYAEVAARVSTGPHTGITYIVLLIHGISSVANIDVTKQLLWNSNNPA